MRPFQAIKGRRRGWRPNDICKLSAIIGLRWKEDPNDYSTLTEQCTVVISLFMSYHPTFSGGSWDGRDK